ncbi:MAG: ABC transporter ATP-binding protein [Nitrospirae bacterium]|nr:MAG: ABC transporter ATP-binding protein [Nitrospirota bacterium]
MKPLLSIENLNIKLIKKGGTLGLVKDLSFQIAESEVFCLVGESGCGKSLTALSILRLLPSNIRAEGRVFFHRLGKDLMSLDESELLNIRGKAISMIFQEPMTSLNPVFTIGYQIEEALRLHEGLSKAEARNRVIKLLKDVKIPQAELRIKDYPHQLSGGMRQRVMIAMAISCNPALLIADEPTTALDVTVQAEILDMLLELQRSRGMSILLITHDLSVVEETAHRVAVMYAGRVVEFAEKDELFENPRHPYTIGLFNSLPGKGKKRLTPIPGAVPSPEELPPGCRFSTRCWMKISECEEREPELKEIGRNHFSRCIRADELSG